MPEKLVTWWRNDEDRVVIDLRDGNPPVGTWTTVNEAESWVRKFRPDLAAFSLNFQEAKRG